MGDTMTSNGPMDIVKTIQELQTKVLNIEEAIAALI